MVLVQLPAINIPMGVYVALLRIAAGIAIISTVPALYHPREQISEYVADLGENYGESVYRWMYGA